MLEPDLGLGAPSGRVGGIGGPREDVAGRFLPGILECACLDAAPPQVGVDAVRRLRRHRHLDAVLGRVAELIGAPHVPVTHRCHHPQLRCPERHEQYEMVVGQHQPFALLQFKFQVIV